MVSNEEIRQKSEQLNNLILTKWLNQEFLSLPWFFIVFLVLACYVLFFYLVDKKRIIEILLFGSLVAVAFVVYDSIGIFFGYWKGLISVLPVYPNFFGSEFTIIPLISMLIYQYTSSWRKFLLLYIGFSVLFIFGYNSVLQNLKIFVYLKPFAILIDFISFSLVGIVARGIMVCLFRIEVRKGNMSAEHALSNLIAQPNIKSTIQRKK
jgi:F0F1-type ATP synthase assembly protein I